MKLILFLCVLFVSAEAQDIRNVMQKKKAVAAAGGTRAATNIVVRDTVRYETVYDGESTARVASLTTSDNTNRLAMLFITTSDAAEVTSATLGVQSFTRKTHTAVVENQHLEIWTLTAPTVGTADVTVNLSGFAYCGFYVALAGYPPIDFLSPISREIFRLISDQ